MKAKGTTKTVHPTHPTHPTTLSPKTTSSISIVDRVLLIERSIFRYTPYLRVRQGNFRSISICFPSNRKVSLRLFCAATLRTQRLHQHLTIYHLGQGPSRTPLNHNLDSLVVVNEGCPPSRHVKALAVGITCMHKRYWVRVC